MSSEHSIRSPGIDNGSMHLEPRVIRRARDGDLTLIGIIQRVFVAQLSRDAGDIGGASAHRRRVFHLRLFFFLSEFRADGQQLSEAAIFALKSGHRLNFAPLFRFVRPRRCVHEIDAGGEALRPQAQFLLHGGIVAQTRRRRGTDQLGHLLPVFGHDHVEGDLMLFQQEAQFLVLALEFRDVSIFGLVKG